MTPRVQGGLEAPGGANVSRHLLFPCVTQQQREQVAEAALRSDGRVELHFYSPETPDRRTVVPDADQYIDGLQQLVDDTRDAGVRDEG